MAPLPGRLPVTINDDRKMMLDAHWLGAARLLLGLIVGKRAVAIKDDNAADSLAWLSQEGQQRGF